MPEKPKIFGSKTALAVSFLLVIMLLTSLACIGPFSFQFQRPETTPTREARPELRATVPQNAPEQDIIPTFTPAPQAVEPGAPSSAPEQSSTGQLPAFDQNLLIRLHEQLNPGVVNIQVIAEQMGAAGVGAGSGFILDDAGHIVTNNHVIEGATQVTVIYYNGYQAEAEVIGTDAYSDLAVLHVSDLIEEAHPLPLGDSQDVQVGEWVVAIGNPFGANSSMTVGIVSAVGRSIPSGATRFSIPEAIQTDAAINPGNSGGPLLNLAGEVIGVNAQIATGGVAANSGVGFAIPANVVRQVVPVLIERGSYTWPYLGVEGQDVNLLIQQANNLETQQGAFIFSATEGGPSRRAGIQGATGTTNIGGVEVPVGGDVVIAADGEPVNNFNDLLVITSQHAPGEEIVLTILREGQTLEIPVTLAPRP